MSIRVLPSEYTTGSGRMASFLTAIFLDAYVFLASLITDPAEFGDRHTGFATLTVTDLVGHNVTIDVSMEASKDGATNWAEIPGAGFVQVTADGEQRVFFAPIDRFARGNLTLGGGARLSAVTPAGSTPPVMTIAGTPTPAGAYDGNHAVAFETPVGGPRQGAGQVGPVSSAGTTPPVMTVAGSPVIGGPLDGAHTVDFEITTGGVLGTAAMRWKIDAGVFSDPAVIPVGGVVVLTGTGITATFAAGTYDVDNTYTFDTVPAATVKYQIDGGAFSTPAPVPASGVLVIAGVTVTFAVGTFNTDNTWAFDTYEKASAKVTLSLECP